MPLPTLSTVIIDDSADDASEQAICPLPCCHIQGSVQVFLRYRLGIYEVGNALDAIETLHSLQQRPPRLSFTCGGSPHKHDPMRDLLYLVKLQDLGSPLFPKHEMTLRSGNADCIVDLLQVLSVWFHTREDLMQNATGTNDIDESSFGVQVGRYLR